MDIKRIRFLETVKVRDREGRVFEAGQEYDLHPPSARRWLMRGKAEPVYSQPELPEAPLARPPEKSASEPEAHLEEAAPEAAEPGPEVSVQNGKPTRPTSRKKKQGV